MVDTMNLAVDTILNISKEDADLLEFDDVLVILATVLAALRDAREILKRSALVGGDETLDIRADASGLLRKWSGKA